MTIESDVTNGIVDLNPSYPEGGDLISEGDDHLRLVKQALKNQFPNLDAPVTATDEQMNSMVTTLGSTDDASQIAGNITFKDENGGLQWNLLGSTPPGPALSGFDAFTAEDPYVNGQNIYGVALGMPVMMVNNPPVPGVTSGFQIYYDPGDATAISGFEFIGVGNIKAGGLSIYDNATGQADLTVAAKIGQIYFQDTVANSGNPVTLNSLAGGALAAKAVQDAHGPLLAYIESLEARIAALEAA